MVAGIEICYMVKYLNEITNGFYLSNIYNINKESLLLKLHHQKKPDIFLVLSTLGIWTTSTKITNLEPNKMLKRLRKDLIRCKIIKISQEETERIIYILFKRFEKEFILIGEFFGEGNIILCNNDMKILSLLHSVEVRHRNLKTGTQYVPPPQNGLNILQIKREKLNEVMESTSTISKWIGNTFGLPTKYTEVICKISEINTKSNCNELSANNLDMLFSTINKIINKIINGNHEPIIIDNNGKLDLYPIKIDNKNIVHTKISTFNEGLDFLFTKKFLTIDNEIKTKEVKKSYLNLENKLKEQKKAIISVNTKSQKINDMAKKLSDIIKLGIIDINDNRLNVILNSYNIIIKYEKGEKIIKNQDYKIKLGEKSTLPSIISILYNESKKQKTASLKIEKIKNKTETKLKEINKKSTEIQKSSVFIKIRQKKWFERYRWFYTSEGLLTIGGRDAESNSILIKKYLEKNDIVFHADIFGSPFFILKNGVNSTDKSRLEVSDATVCFSRAWRENVYGSNAYWVYHNQIKKTAPTGQFLNKGSFVIEGKRNYIKSSTLKLAICLQEMDKEITAICCPLESIKKCLGHVIIEPTGFDVTNIAKIIKKQFTVIKDISESITLDDLIRIMPSGKCHITKNS